MNSDFPGNKGGKGTKNRSRNNEYVFNIFDQDLWVFRSSIFT